MSEYANREFELYRKDEHEARAIFELAKSEDRTVTPEEDERFNKLVDSAEAHKARGDKLAALDAESQAVEALLRSHPATEADPRSGEGEPSKIGNEGLLEAVRSMQSEFKGNRRELEQIVEMKIDLVKRSELRAIADFSDNGALYTTDFATQIAVYQRTLSPWIDLSSIMNANNGRPLNVPKLTADNTTYTPGEGTAITESSSTIGSAALTTTAYKGLSYVSAEAEEDELIGLLPVLARQQARSIGLSFGSGATTAVLAAINNGGTAGGLGAGQTATFFGLDDLIDLEYGRAVPYRATGRGVWIMSNGAIKKVRKFVDKNGQYLWEASKVVGQPPTFDGFPVYEDPNLAAPASATKSVVFGDPNAALLIKQMPLRVAVSTDFKFDTDQVAIKSVYRAGIAVPDPAGLAYLVSANS